MKVDLDELKKQLDSNEIINIIKTLVPDLRYSKQNVLQKEREREKPIAELYAKKEEPKPKKFRPTPVISPVCFWK